MIVIRILSNIEFKIIQLLLLLLFFSRVGRIKTFFCVEGPIMNFILTNNLKNIFEDYSQKLIFKKCPKKNGLLGPFRN